MKILVHMRKKIQQIFKFVLFAIDLTLDTTQVDDEHLNSDNSSFEFTFVFVGFFRG